MDDITLYGKSEVDMAFLLNTKNVGTKFGLDKCAYLIIKCNIINESGLQVISGNAIRYQVFKEGYKYLGLMEISYLLHD